MGLVTEVAVGVHHKEFGRVLIVARIVPPPAQVAAKPAAHQFQISVIRHRPNIAASDIDANLLGSRAKRLIKLTGTLLAYPSVSIKLWHIVQRLYSIGSGCTLFVPLVIYALLECSEIVGAQLHDGMVAGYAHIVDKDSKLTHTQLVHALKLRHNLVKHLRVFGISKRFARVNCPDEVDLGLAGNLCDIAHHVLVKIANALLVFSNRCRVGVAPIMGMIWIALCAIHIGVHLVSGHEAKQVLCHLGGIRHSIVALDDAAVLDIGIVVDCDTWQVCRALIEHLL